MPPNKLGPRPAGSLWPRPPRGTEPFRHSANSIGTAAYVRLLPSAWDAKMIAIPLYRRFARRPRKPGLCLAFNAWRGADPTQGLIGFEFEFRAYVANSNVSATQRGLTFCPTINLIKLHYRN